MAEKEVTGTTEACDLCNQTIDKVDYLINMVNGDTICPDCRTITNYNGGL